MTTTKAPKNRHLWQAIRTLFPDEPEEAFEVPEQGINAHVFFHKGRVYKTLHGMDKKLSPERKAQTRRFLDQEIAVLKSFNADHGRSLQARVPRFLGQIDEVTFVQERLAGEPIMRAFLEERSPSFYAALGYVLADFTISYDAAMRNQAVATSLPPLRIQANLSVLSYAHATPEQAQELQAIRARIEEARKDPRPWFLHGDLSNGNILYDAKALRFGIVDFGGACWSLPESQMAMMTYSHVRYSLKTLPPFISLLSRERGHRFDKDLFSLYMMRLFHANDIENTFSPEKGRALLQDSLDLGHFLSQTARRADAVVPKVRRKKNPEAVL